MLGVFALVITVRAEPMTQRDTEATDPIPRKPPRPSTMLARIFSMGFVTFYLLNFGRHRSCVMKQEESGTLQYFPMGQFWRAAAYKD